MNRVERDAEVTVGVLVYRSLRWLDWFLDGLESSRQRTRFRVCVLSNDATPQVRNDPRVTVNWENADPNEHYLARTYRAWTECVLNAPTQLVILANSDMFCSDYAIDELVMAKRERPKTLPCGLLIEHGRINSGMPEYVADYGTNPNNFQRNSFLTQADKVRRRGESEPGRLFQPVIFDRQEYFDMDGYPEGNVDGVSGDRILFNRYIKAGYEWQTCLGSVWYHAQEGERRWP